MDAAMRCLFHHGSYFCSEIVLSLLDALALFKANELLDLDAAAKRFSGVLGVLSNGELAVLNELPDLQGSSPCSLCRSYRQRS